MIWLCLAAIAIGALWTLADCLSEGKEGFVPYGLGLVAAGIGMMP